MLTDLGGVKAPGPRFLSLIGQTALERGNRTQVAESWNPTTEERVSAQPQKRFPVLPTLPSLVCPPSAQALTAPLCLPSNYFAALVLGKPRQGLFRVDRPRVVGFSF